MKLPHFLSDSRYFQYSSLSELKKSLEGIEGVDIPEIERLDGIQLPPVASPNVLAAMFGINPGIIWAFVSQTHKYYRTFPIKKGSGFRIICAPKVGLKVIQKWLSVQLQKIYAAPPHVFGFVPGRSHLDAANIHCNAKWVYSVDIKDFFPSTPLSNVAKAFMDIGYSEPSSVFLARLCCLRDFLAQGAPTSPVLSNICFAVTDHTLAEIAHKFGVRLSRYADDIVFSGVNEFDERIQEEVANAFEITPWKLSKQKTELSRLPDRLKVHGLLVHGERIRLTKGYRNKIRAYAHLRSAGKIKDEDVRRIDGHLLYGKYVTKRSETQEN